MTKINDKYELVLAETCDVEAGLVANENLCPELAFAVGIC